MVKLVKWLVTPQRGFVGPGTVITAALVAAGTGWTLGAVNEASKDRVQVIEVAEDEPQSAPPAEPTVEPQPVITAVPPPAPVETTPEETTVSKPQQQPEKPATAPQAGGKPEPVPAETFEGSNGDTVTYEGYSAPAPVLPPAPPPPPRD